MPPIVGQWDESGNATVFLDSSQFTIFLTSTPWLATILPLMQQRLGRVFQFMTERIFRSLLTDGLWYGFHKNLLFKFYF